MHLLRKLLACIAQPICNACTRAKGGRELRNKLAVIVTGRRASDIAHEFNEIPAVLCLTRAHIITS